MANEPTRTHARRESGDDELTANERDELVSILNGYGPEHAEALRKEYVERAALRRACADHAPRSDTSVLFAWLRDIISACWAGRPPAWLAGRAPTNSVLAPDASRRWARPMTEREVHDLEERFEVRFPSDYVAFLTTLHRIEGNPPRGLSFDSSPEEAFTRGVALLPEFVWAAWVNREWLPAWEPFRARTIEECADQLREILETAEPLVAANGRFLVCSETPGLDCVISVKDFDAIIWTDSFRNHVVESLLFVDSYGFLRPGSDAYPHGFESTFWGRVVRYNITSRSMQGPNDAGLAKRREEANEWCDAYWASR